MALEINEIGIRMRVRGDEEEPPPRESAPGGYGDRNHEQVVEDCVRRVLQILRNLQER